MHFVPWKQSPSEPQVVEVGLPLVLADPPANPSQTGSLQRFSKVKSLKEVEAFAFSALRRRKIDRETI